MRRTRSRPCGEHQDALAYQWATLPPSASKFVFSPLPDGFPPAPLTVKSSFQRGASYACDGSATAGQRAAEAHGASSGQRPSLTTLFTRVPSIAALYQRHDD